jgi:hypothetical protein
MSGSVCEEKEIDPLMGRSSQRKVGWGGRIRTFTVLINSEVSYQLDHAPAVLETASGKQAGNAAKKLALGKKIITRGARP